MTPGEWAKYQARVVEAELNRGSGPMWPSPEWVPQWEKLDAKVVEQNRKLLSTWRSS